MMRTLGIAVVFAACLLCFADSRPLPNLQQWLGLGKNNKEVDSEGNLWALLIAGSAGYGNYRHQADVAHAYQVLHRGGVPDERIVVMVYDDIANNPANPRPGTLINSPDGPDVYAGMPRDYTGEEVNAQNFLAVLAGNDSAVSRNDKSSGRVIAAGPTDRIFVFYSDHGAPGIVGMPSGEFLYADQLHKAIKHRSKHHGFKEMVLYIEACESGSMFEGLLEDNLEIYATTAANGQESSWASYCPGMDPSPPPEYMTCLGDLYSVAWLEDSDINDLTHESLKKQFQRVRQRTSQNFTFSQGSHVERFGQLEIDEEPAANFIGKLNTGRRPAPSSSALLGSSSSSFASYEARVGGPLGAVPQREADLMPLVMKAKHAAGTPEGDAAAAELATERTRRESVDRNVLNTVSLLASRSNALGLLNSMHGGAGSLGEVLVTESMPAPQGSALVSDWDCLRAMVAAWQGACGPMDQYTMRHTRAFANLCNLGVAPHQLGATASEVCPGGSAAPVAAAVVATS